MNIKAGGGVPLTLLTVGQDHRPLDPVLQISTAIRLMANNGFIFSIPYESKLSTVCKKQNHLLAKVAVLA
jgi:hypothetical protein